MKEHRILVVLRFTSREFPDEPEWSQKQWEREVAALLEDEYRGLAQYRGCEVVSLLIGGVSTDETKEG